MLASAARALSAEDARPEVQLTACTRTHEHSRRAGASGPLVGLKEGEATPSTVYLVPAKDAPLSRSAQEHGDASTLPELTLAAPARVRATEPLDLSLAWRAPPDAAVTIAHPFHSGGKTQVVYTLYVRDEATKRVYELVDETPMMCGTRNALGERDFIPLGPGERAKVTPRSDTGADLGRTHLVEPARITVWMSYAFCGPSFLLTPDRRPPPHTFSGEVVSNAVQIEVY